MKEKCLIDKACENLYALCRCDIRRYHMGSVAYVICRFMKQKTAKNFFKNVRLTEDLVCDIA